MHCYVEFMELPQSSHIQSLSTRQRVIAPDQIQLGQVMCVLTMKVNRSKLNCENYLTELVCLKREL